MYGSGDGYAAGLIRRAGQLQDGLADEASAHDDIRGRGQVARGYAARTTCRPRGGYLLSGVAETTGKAGSLRVGWQVMGENPWFATTKFDPRAVGIFRRHYSYRNGNRRAGITGPGECMTLLTQDCRALWVWRYAKYFHFPIQDAVYCAVFRNESEHQSSDLIRWAVELAGKKWPGKQLFTFIDPKAIESANPGYCFKVAGWAFTGRTKRGLHILEKAA